MPLRQIRAALGLACLLIAGLVAPAVAQVTLVPLEAPGGVDVVDLVGDDLGWQCDRACDVEKMDARRLEILARSDDIGPIVAEGGIIYVDADAGHEQVILAYRAVDRASGVSAPVQVNLWFGYRAPTRGKLRPLDGARSDSDAAEHSTDPDEGDIIDLVGTQCPKEGYLFLTQINGRLQVFFQPDADFPGAGYFRYASAHQTGSAYQPAAAAMAVPSFADDLAEGMVSEEDPASPS
jgi:hypothetical protein